MTTWCRVNLPRKSLKLRLTRVQYDFDVSVPKISTPRFSTTLISVEYLTTIEIYRPGHQPLKSALKLGSQRKNSQWGHTRTKLYSQALTNCSPNHKKWSGGRQTLSFVPLSSSCLEDPYTVAKICHASVRVPVAEKCAITFTHLCYTQTFGSCNFFSVAYHQSFSSWSQRTTKPSWTKSTSKFKCMTHF